MTTTAHDLFGDLAEIPLDTLQTAIHSLTHRIEKAQSGETRESVATLREQRDLGDAEIARRIDEARELLGQAAHLLQGARPSGNDRGLNSAWGKKRKAVVNHAIDLGVF